MQEEQERTTSREDAPCQREGEFLRVKLADIVTRKAWQVRTRLNAATVTQYLTAYRADADALPPVKVANVNGTLLLVDGWHRIEALKLLGRYDVPAWVFPATEEEARWEAARANLTHGLPLKAREVRNVFRAYVRSKRHRTGGRFKSYREIAADLASRVAYTTVRNWMQKEYPAIYRAMQADYDEEKVDWSENGPPGRPGVSSLDAARGNLDAALNEARSMRASERAELVAYGREVLAMIERAKPWSVAEALPDPGDNDDF
jgi:hypothetical protein